MAKTDKKINEVLNQLFSGQDRLAKNYQNFSIDGIWRETFGDTISKYTERVELRKTKLTVYLSSAPLRQELEMRKEKILLRLNENLKYLQVNQILFK